MIGGGEPGVEGDGDGSGDKPGEGEERGLVKKPLSERVAGVELAVTGYGAMMLLLALADAVGEVNPDRNSFAWDPSSTRG